MICPKYFTNELVNRGVSFFSGVPCSYLTPLINEVIASEQTNYVIASSEGDALGMAAGAWLSGKHSVVLCQNSGLGNMINPLTSLNAPFDIPVLLLITWRGKPGEPDEPQHEMMGQITTSLLDLMGIKWSYFPDNEADVLKILDTAFVSMQKLNRPYALILHKDSFSTSDAEPMVQVNEISYPRREEALAAILNYVPEFSPIIATTGKTGRELYTLRDHAKHLYCVGSMGYANSIAHGLALNIKEKVFVIDGDGSAIMHLGNFTSIGGSGVSNLVHIVLDNGVHDSTGGQATVSSSIDFSGVAQSVGYKKQIFCSSLADLNSALDSLNTNGPILIHLKIRSGSMKQLGRPTIKPNMVARRLRHYVTTITEE